ncbi:hypothetical protein [Agrobacterium tumefaciens]|uniref:hypothetical protein n=1 Tax=Agrobacterium tumefaciens TaxID=358 RepID=UPI003B9DEB24
MTAVAQYGSLLETNSSVLKSVADDEECLQAMTTSHNRIADLQAICDTIGHRLEADLLRNAIEEYQFAIYAISIGNYRHGHGSLRLFLELSLSCIYFSAHEIKLRNWLRSRQDIVWSAIIDKENGIFSVNFIRAFCDELADGNKTYLTLAEKVYRECSEYVHGNAHTFSTPQKVTFNRDVFLEWNSKAESIWLCFLFAFLVRYSDALDETARTNIEQIMMENLGTLKFVRAMYGAQ